MRKIDRADALIVAGIAFTIGGIAMIHVPSATIMFGLILTAIGFFHSLPPKR